MFTYDGTELINGAPIPLYYVRLFAGPTPHYVLVDTYLPVWDFGFYYAQPVNGVLWVPLLEKAYAQANGSQYVWSSNPGVNSYEALTGGKIGESADAMHCITGQASCGQPLDNTAINDVTNYWSSGLYVVSTLPNVVDTHLVPNHEYAIIGYDASSKTPFRLFNPHGVNPGNGEYGVFSCNAAYLLQNFGYMCIGGYA